MKINIFGSTGIIGTKTLSLIKNNFTQIRVNLLCANNNLNLIHRQINLFKPKYVYLENENKAIKLKNIINKNIIVLNKKELSNYLKTSKSDYTILAISGIKSLNFLDEIIINTDNLGIVSKEAIVSAGHLFFKKKYNKKTNIFPLDSEHYSIFEYFKNHKQNNVNKIVLTASGGPFFNKNYNTLKNIKFNEAIKHPKWKMGAKNSLDSATLVNKCLEIIEAHYLFNIPFDKIDIKIHQEALVHSIIEEQNYVSKLIMFKNDMKIPLNNFLLKLNKKENIVLKNLFKYDYKTLSFQDVDNKIFPIYKYFRELDKEPINLIKFNIGNEFALKLFKSNKILYTDIFRIIKKSVSLNLYSKLNNIKDIVKYHEEFELYLQKYFKNII